MSTWLAVFCIAWMGATAPSASAHLVVPPVQASPSTVIIGDQPAQTEIRFTLRHRAHVKLTVVGEDGLVNTLCLGSRGRGSHNFSWDGKDVAGNVVLPGTYSVVLKVHVKKHAPRTRRAKVYVRSGPPEFARWPVSGELGDGYGPRGSGWHSGIDILTRGGVPILAPAAGTVTFAGWKGDYGNTVILHHPASDHETLYAHQSKLAVKVGDEVADGAVIGWVGASGNATAPHLHFELQVDGHSINPLPSLPARD